MALEVILAPAAARDLDALPAVRREQVLGDLQGFAAKPVAVPPRLKQLRGFKPPLFRLRSGDYRVLFRTVEATLHVYRVVDRKELERALSRIR